MCVPFPQIEYRSEEIEQSLVAVVGLRRGSFAPLLGNAHSEKIAFLQCLLKLCVDILKLPECLCVSVSSVCIVHRSNYTPAKRYSNLCCNFVDNKAHVIDNSAVTTTNSFIHSFITNAECSRKMCNDINMAIIHQLFGNFLGVTL